MESSLVGSGNWTDSEWADYWRRKQKATLSRLEIAEDILQELYENDSDRFMSKEIAQFLSSRKSA